MSALTTKHHSTHNLYVGYTTKIVPHFLRIKSVAFVLVKCAERLQVHVQNPEYHYTKVFVIHILLGNQNARRIEIREGRI